LFFLGFQDVYWEVPQAILIGVLLLKLTHGRFLAVSRN
jgi:hypothetical protein